MNGYEYDIAKARMNNFVAEAERHQLVATALSERRAAQALARAERSTRRGNPFRKVLVLVGAALHSVG